MNKIKRLLTMVVLVGGVKGIKRRREITKGSRRMRKGECEERRELGRMRRRGRRIVIK